MSQTVQVIEPSKEEKVKLELDSIIQLFQSPEKLPAFCARALIDAPLKPSSKWSLSNQLLMLINGTEDARGFQQWKEVNRFVKKGSRAFYILGPLLVNRRPKDGETIDAENPDKVLIGFRGIPVFRFEDTEGAALEPYKPKTLPPLLSVAEKWGLKIQYERLGRANGSFGDNTITLATEHNGTFFHELAHAAHSKIETLKAGQDPEQEAIAQLSSCVLSRIFGFDDSAYTFHYIASYAADHSSKAVGQLCLRVLGKVQKIVNSILECA